jgi:hypothetical protein
LRSGFLPRNRQRCEVCDVESTDRGAGRASFDFCAGNRRHQCVAHVSGIGIRQTRHSGNILRDVGSLDLGWNKFDITDPAPDRYQNIASLES